MMMMLMIIQAQIKGERELALKSLSLNNLFVAKPITTPEIQDDSYEVSPSLLNLITRKQFGGSAMEDASMHLHDFVEICDM